MQQQSVTTNNIREAPSGIATERKVNRKHFTHKLLNRTI